MIPRRPPGDPEKPMSAGDLWFLAGVALAAVTFICLAMDRVSWPWFGMAAGFALGKGTTKEGSKHA